MEEKLKKAVVEIGELIKTLPESVQVKAFEMLLAAELGEHPPKKAATQKETAPPADDKVVVENLAATDAEDITNKDLHLKAKKFLEKQGISLEQINELFYKQDGELKPLYEELKTTKTSESQIRLSLLAALKNGLLTGDFEFSGESVRQQCVERKCYDQGNFASNFKNNANLFEGYDGYDKKSPTIRLSEAGRKELASVIKELQ